MDNSNESAKVISLYDLWRIFYKKLPYMLIAAAVTIGVMFAVIQATYVPKYKSTATLYILKQNDKSGSTSQNTSTSSDFSLALNVVKDCNYLLKSHAVLDKVIEELDLNISYQELSQSISTSNPDNTRILEVTVLSSTPENAKRIVDEVCQTGCDQITKAMGFQQTNFYEYGIINSNPCNKTGMKTYLLAGAGAAVLVYAVFFLIFLLDDSIRTNEDIEKYLGLTILGDIPNADAAEGSKYGKYSKYSKYSYQSNHQSNNTKNTKKETR